MTNRSEADIKRKIGDIELLLKGEKYEEAIQLCNEILDVDDECYAVYSRRCEIYHAIGNHQEAFRDLEKLIELRPQSPSAYVRRAEWNLARGEDKLVLNDVDFVIQSKDPFFLTVAHFYRALALLNLGNKAEALKDCLELPLDYKFYADQYRTGGRIITRDDILRKIESAET